MFYTLNVLYYLQMYWTDVRTPQIILFNTETLLINLHIIYVWTILSLVLNIVCYHDPRIVIVTVNCLVTKKSSIKYIYQYIYLMGGDNVILIITYWFAVIVKPKDDDIRYLKKKSNNTTQGSAWEIYETTLEYVTIANRIFETLQTPQLSDEQHFTWVYSFKCFNTECDLLGVTHTTYT